MIRTQVPRAGFAEREEAVLYPDQDACVKNIHVLDGSYDTGTAKHLTSLFDLVFVVLVGKP